MYVVLVYDISSEKNGAKVMRNTFKICKKYLTHIQNSTFEGEMNEAKLVKLHSELKEYIRKDLDSLIIFKSESNKWMKKEFWAKTDEKTSNFF